MSAPGSNVITISDLAKREKSKASKKKNNPVNKPSRETSDENHIKAAELTVDFVRELVQENPNHTTLVVEDISDEQVNNVLQNKPIWNHINANYVREKAEEAGNDWANDTAAQLNVSNAGDTIKKARRAVTKTLPKTRDRSHDSETVSSDIKCPCSCCQILCIVIIVVVAVSAGIQLFFPKLDFIKRKPGDEPREDEDEDPTDDKTIVAAFNQAASAYGVGISKPFTSKDIAPLLKEGHDWMWMPEKTWWMKNPVREVPNDERMSTDHVLYQILVLGAFTDPARMIIALKPEWTWIFPKDGTLLSAVLAGIYKEQGVDAMYDYIGDFKYYKKTLPRAVAIDVAITALSQVLGKSTKNDKA
ncbi:hypothetical protein F5Y18DRAFT_408997 [Xylariaceae sp. FL1019]|nr:hypothetical protein F5Y18DRAFT_408997 [Xylariaceae sp. FL1019]